jgi:hypothetical protein
VTGRRSAGYTIRFIDLNLEAGDASELIPFFEGLVNLGKMRGHMRLRITVIAVYFS